MKIPRKETSFEVVILRFRDADTLEARISLPFGIFVEKAIRLADIESWELEADPTRSPNFPAPVDRARALRARDILTGAFRGRIAVLRLRRQSPDCYGRLIGNVDVDGQDLAARIVQEGLAWYR